MKILSVVDGVGWSGTKEQVYLLARELSQHVDFHMALSFEYKQMVQKLSPHRVRFNYFEHHGRYNRLNPLNYYRLWRMIKEGNFDIVIANSPHALDFVTLVYPFLKKPPKLVAVKRSARLPNSLSLWLKYRRVDKLVAVSEKVFEVMLKAGYPKEKLIFIPSGIDTYRFKKNKDIRPMKRMELGIHPAAKVFINVANWNPPVKGQDRLIETFLKLDCKDCYLLLVGLETEKHSIPQKGVLGLGFREDVEELLNASDFFVLSSFLEGLPNALLQAMACGLVVISTLAGGVGGFLIDGFNGFSLPVGDFDTMLEKMKKVLELSQEEYAIISERAMETAQNFSIRRTAEKYLELFRELLR
ncbi:MAG: glycosyltransferase family 4 protein [Aquificaceae bacterium]